MSDLAPFVAAALRDKVVSELLEEVQKLRENEHSLEYVEITGPNRQPVYARGHLRDNGYEDDDGRFWFVDMDAEQQLPCPLEGIKDIEIWVRNVKAKEVTQSFARIGFEPTGSSPLALLTLDKECAVMCNFDFSQEERRNIEASAAEAHSQSDCSAYGATRFAL